MCPGKVLCEYAQIAHSPPRCLGQSYQLVYYRVLSLFCPAFFCCNNCNSMDALVLVQIDRVICTLALYECGQCGTEYYNERRQSNMYSTSYCMVWHGAGDLWRASSTLMGIGFSVYFPNRQRTAWIVCLMHLKNCHVMSIFDNLNCLRIYIILKDGETIEPK